MIKAVIFDLWGTLVYNKNHIGSYIQRIENIIGEANINIFKELRKEWYVTRWSSDEFFTKLSLKINLPNPIKDELIKIWEEQIEDSYLFDDTEFIFKKLKSMNIKLILLSNTTPISNEIIKKLDIAKYFDSVFFSCNEGILKPTPIIYNKLLIRLRLEPNEVLAVGDQLNTDIIGAEAYGIKSILIDRENKNIRYKGEKISELDEIEFYFR